jgi:hypothetical protein
LIYLKGDLRIYRHGYSALLRQRFLPTDVPRLLGSALSLEACELDKMITTSPLPEQRRRCSWRCAMATIHDGTNHPIQDAILITAVLLLFTGIISLWFFV